VRRQPVTAAGVNMQHRPTQPENGRAGCPSGHADRHADPPCTFGPVGATGGVPTQHRGRESADELRNGIWQDSAAIAEHARSDHRHDLEHPARGQQRPAGQRSQCGPSLLDSNFAAGCVTTCSYPRRATRPDRWQSGPWHFKGRRKPTSSQVKSHLRRLFFGRPRANKLAGRNFRRARCGQPRRCEPRSSSWQQPAESKITPSHLAGPAPDEVKPRSSRTDRTN
jgi:hypothetical protein